VDSAPEINDLSNCDQDAAGDEQSPKEDSQVSLPVA
jgi:hypothetical protein